MERSHSKKALALVLSCAMVASSVTISGTTTMADLTTEQMIANVSYNLALNKTATANPSKQEGQEAALTDGKFDGEHAATTFGTAGTSFVIDLGEGYDASGIDQIVTRYKEKNNDDIPVNGYKIQFSTDSVNYTDVKAVTGDEIKSVITEENLTDVQDVKATGKVRYVRLFYPESYKYGIQAREIAVLDTDKNATKVELDKCDDVATVTVGSDYYNTMKYEFTAGENQEGYVYMAYLDGKTLVGSKVTPGTVYELSDIEAGKHTIKIISIYNGAVSDGKISDAVTVKSIAELITNKNNIASRVNNPKAVVASVSSLYKDHNMTTANKVVDGNLNSGEGPEMALRTGAGSPQNFVIDLGGYYTPSEFSKVLLGYTNDRTYAADTKIEFSRDNTTYTAVGASTGYQCKGEATGTAFVNALTLNNLDKYTEIAVRYVRVTLSNGSSQWGYVVNECGIILNTDTPTKVTPDIAEAKDVTVTSDKLGEINYNITADEGQEDYEYIVRLNGEIINDKAVAGTDYTYTMEQPGTYQLKVEAKHNGWISTGISKSVTVDGYVNYIGTGLNLVYKNTHPSVNVTSTSDFKNKVGPGEGDVSAGPEVLNNGVYTDHGHHSGYLQTVPTDQDVEILYTLDREYAPTDIHSVIASFEDAGRAATDYEILLSGDGEKYEQVFSAEGVEWKELIQDTVDVSNYTQDTVKYVKYHIIDGNHTNGKPEPDPSEIYLCGYHICEIAVMGDYGLMPAKATDVTAASPEFKKLVVSWKDVEDTDCTYNIYVNGAIVARDIAQGVQTKEFQMKAGTYKVAIGTVRKGIENKTNEVSAKVEEETTTPEPTTPKPTTPKPTTPKPITPSNVTTTTSPKTTTKSAVPAKAKIAKAKAGKKKVAIKIKKVKGAKGYRIKYSTNKKFKKAKTVSVTKLTTVIKKLKTGKVYYFKVQAYSKAKGKKIYGKWSSVTKSKKVK